MAFGITRATRLRTLLAVLVVLSAAYILQRDSHEVESAATLPVGFTEEVVATGLELPTSVTMLPDGRMLVTEKAGLIKVIKNGELLATPFADLRFEVNNYWDRGLVSIVPDPAFATNGFVYLYYTYDSGGTDDTGPLTNRITRVRAAGDVMEPGSETVILGSVTGPACISGDTNCIPQDFYGHGADTMLFLPDGTMLVSQGDASSWDIVDDRALRAQDVNQYPGKILRITTTGQGVASNPFWNGDPNAIRSKVFAYGLRNPFRIAYDPTTATAWVGDVGWGVAEEFEPITPAANFGWPCYEGAAQNAGYASKAVCSALYAAGASAVVSPQIEVPHSGGGGAAVQGPFTPASSNFPAAFKGGFFYADYAQNFIRFAKVTNRTVTSTVDFATDVPAPVDLKFGADGNLYYVSISTGEVRRIRVAGVAPTVYLSDLTPSSPAVNAWGPYERDRSNGEVGATDGGPLTINGTTYAKGLGAHAASEIRFSVPAGCQTFSAQVGLDDEVGDNGSITFEVWDGGSTRLYQSPLKTGADAATAVTVALSDATSIRLVMVAGASQDYDHGDWGDAKFTCASDDTAPPTVTAVKAAPSSTGATISWTTNEISDSQVEYGPSTSYGFATAVASAGVTSHYADFGGLAPSTLYHYRVKSRDAAGNLATSGDFTFTTGAAGIVYVSDLVPTSEVNGHGPWERDRSNGELSANDGRALTIQGTTYAKGIGAHAASDLGFTVPAGCTSLTVSVGIDDEVGDNAGSIVFEVWNGTTTRLYQSPNKTGAQAATVATVSLSGVTTLRLVQVPGTTNTSDHGDWADARMTCSTADTTAPTIVNVAAQPGPSGATVTWQTNENSDSQVEYGRTTSYGSSTTLDATKLGAHSQTISGLQPNTLYNYRVKSRDAAGNLATGANGTFTTSFDEAPPIISGVAASPTSSGATIVWNTNEPATTQIEYGRTTTYGSSTTLAPALITSHSQAITGLPVATLYHYRVKSTDAGGNTTVSADATFTTSTDRTAPTLTSIAATPGSNGANVTWVTNEPADTQVEYGLTTSYGSSTTLAPEMVANHSQGVSGLAANTTYHYRVKSRDAAGNLATSSDKTFKTGVAGTSTVYLSDLPDAGGAINGHGPYERDRSNGEMGATDGATLTIQGTTFTKGLGAHAASDIRFPVPAGCTTFQASVGIDDEVGNSGSVVFEVWNGTSTRLYQSPNKTGSQSATAVSVSLSGVTMLRLVQVPGTDNSFDHGDWGNARLTCTSSNSAPVPTVTSPGANALFKVGDTVTLSGSATDAEDGPIPGARLGWQVNLQHCPGGQCHMHPFITVTGATASFVAPDHGDDSYLEVILTATDSGGRTASKTVIVNPQTVKLTLDTFPSGLQLIYSGAMVTTPFMTNVIVGGTRTVEAPTTQGSNAFASWSDGGAAAHNITMPATVASRVATYTNTDTTAPAISAVAVTPAATSATVTWTTDEASDTQVEYGLTTSYGSSTTLNTAKLTSHSQALTGLTAATTYHYRVKSRDAAGNLATSPDREFTTASAAAASTAGTGTRPHSVIVADFNEDGVADLAVANAGDASVSVLRGAGNGTFATAVNYGAGLEPKSVAAADLNEDQHLDLVVTNQNSNSVSVLLGRGDGTFAAKVDYAASTNAHESAIGDFDEDGHLDLAVAGWGSSSIALLRGNGDGTFHAATFVAAGSGPHSIVAVDLNGDQHLDLAVVNNFSSDASVFLGHGDGTFDGAVNYATGLNPHSIRAADLDGDGDLELVTANQSDDTVSIFRNNGNGTFQPRTDLAVGNTPKGVTLADINGDGKLDVLTANINDNYPSLVNPGGDSVTVRLGNGNGTFASATQVVVGQGPFQVAVGRFNSGSKYDLVTADWYDARVTVRLDFLP